MADKFNQIIYNDLATLGITDVTKKLIWKASNKINIAIPNSLHIDNVELLGIGGTVEINYLIIFFPYTFDLDIEKIMRGISFKKWIGSIIVYDVKCKSTEMWIKTMPYFKYITIDNVYDVAGDKRLFKIIWTKKNVDLPDKNNVDIKKENGLNGIFDITHNNI